MATVKTIRLEVAYQNEWGKILWNREWRIFTIEVDGEDEEKRENAKHLLDEFHKEINVLQDAVTSSEYHNEEAMKAFKDTYGVQVFMGDDDTHLIMDQGPYEPEKVAFRQMMGGVIKNMLRDNPELKELIPPHLRHRFE